MVTARGSCDARALSQTAEMPPARTLLGNINSHLICVLCKGYYIDATTIVECLHTFCRSCIVKHLRVKSYCPVCEMMINSAKPNIKLDKALQDIVYKLVPGLFQREMARRRAFYADRPHLAADATPEQRGEDTERVVFSPDDVISFSLEYADCGDDVGSSGSSESGNEAPPSETSDAATRRYLRCPAVVNISHLKKFLSLKFDIDSTNFYVNILYKRVPLPDYYTLMDIAYIYNWKRIEPMRFFYRIANFTAVRDRFGFVDISSGNGNGRRGPAPLSGPPPSDASSDGSSPPPDDTLSRSKSTDELSEIRRKGEPRDEETSVSLAARTDRSKSPIMDVEKSQFLNAFDLTAKCGSASGKSTSPIKDDTKFASEKVENIESTKTPGSVKTGAAKRKPSVNTEPVVELKRLKMDNEQVTKSKNVTVLENLLLKVQNQQNATLNSPKSEQKPVPDSIPMNKVGGLPIKTTAMSNSSSKPVSNVKTTAASMNSPIGPPITTTSTVTTMNPPATSDSLSSISQPASAPSSIIPKLKKTSQAPSKYKSSLNKKSLSATLKSIAYKKKYGEIIGVSNRLQSESETSEIVAKMNSEATKVQQLLNMKLERKTALLTAGEKLKSSVGPPSLGPSIQKPSIPPLNTVPKLDNKKPMENKETQKTVNVQNNKPKGDPIRSLFDSCNINIPSSLSITLSDQKTEEKSAEPIPEKTEVKKTQISNLVTTNPSMQISSIPIVAPSDKNYLEIIKLTDAENSKSSEVNPPVSKPALSSAKSHEPIVTAKGPVPNLKPISEAKIVPISKPQTFQQTFLQSLQQLTEKPKFNKTRLVMPKLNSPGSVSGKPDDVSETGAKPGTSLTKQPPPSISPIQKISASKNIKSDSALDLSTPHTVQSQLGPQQAKALETMQSIASLAKKQCFSQRSIPLAFAQESFKTNTSPSATLRVPTPLSNNSLLKVGTSQSSSSSSKHLSDYFQPSKQVGVRSASEINNANQNSKSPCQLPSPQINTERSQTRSPSSSPKLVIACPSPKSQSPEQKQFISPRNQENNNQSNLTSIPNMSNTNLSLMEAAGSKDSLKMIKNLKPPPISKLSSIRGSNVNNNANKSNTNNNSSTENLHNLSPQMSPQEALLWQQVGYSLLPGSVAPSQWLNNPVARAHFENIIKNIPQSSRFSYGGGQSSKDK